MIPSPRHLRRIINMFTDRGNVDIVFGGGCILSFYDCEFHLREIAIWDNRSHMIEYTFYGRDWMLRLIDSPCQGKRLLQVVGHTPDTDKIAASLKGFRR